MAYASSFTREETKNPRRAMILFENSDKTLKHEDIKHVVYFEKNRKRNKRACFFVITRTGDIYVFMAHPQGKDIKEVSSGSLLLHLEGGFSKIETVKLTRKHTKTFGIAKGKGDAAVISLNGGPTELLFRGNYSIYSGDGIPFIIRAEQSTRPYTVSTFSLITGKVEEYPSVHGSYLCQNQLILRYGGTTHHVVEYNENGESIGYPNVLNTLHLKAAVVTRYGCVFIKSSGQAKWVELYHPATNSYQVYENVFWINIDHDVRGRFIEVVSVESAPTKTLLDTATGKVVDSESSS